MKKYIYISVIALLLVFQNAYSQSTINIIKVEPLNRATIYLNGVINSFSSSLSDDKKTITVKIPKFKTNTMLPTINSSGIISSVSQEPAGDGVNIIVKLMEGRGYNCVYLPMSNSLMIEVFDWRKLSSDEERYRDALLALENFQFLFAKRQLQSINLKDNPNAAGILGLIQMQENKLDVAKKSLQIAFDGNSNIPDVYSALAQLGHNSKDSRQYDYYINKYASITGRKDFLPITSKEMIDTNAIGQYDSLMFLNSMGTPAVDVAEQAKDTTKQEAVTKDTTVNSPNENLMQDKTIFYITFISVVILIMILSTYFRWRKKQIKMLTELSMAATNFKDAEKPLAYREPKANRKAMLDTDKSIKNNSNIHPAIQKYMDNKMHSKTTIKPPKDVTPKPVNSANIQQKQKEVLNLAEKILETQKVKKEIESKLENENAKYKKNPNLDLALSLQKKEQDIKSERISHITEKTPKEELNGISASAIDAKLKLNKLQESKSEIEKLAEQFKGNEGKNTSK